MKKEKLSLDEFRVNSFVTSESNQEKLKGGSTPLCTGIIIGLTISIAAC